MSDRFFWIVVVLATLTLGGFLYFFATAFSRPREITDVPRPAPPRVTAANVVLATTPASTEVPTETSVAAQPAPEVPATEMASEEDSYIEIPTGKPFLSRDDFIRKPPPKPAVKRPPQPPPTKPQPKPAATPNSAPEKKPSIASLLDKRKVVVMSGGKKIIAQTIVDLGDSFGIKDDRNQMLTVKKDDVLRIERP
ncbi:MAG TPA: hypothetical protein VEJ63_10835 [Planctomycetota bacterium]|nr:hypothetical protein [Planctomycetota bacterium]